MTRIDKYDLTFHRRARQECRPEHERRGWRRRAGPRALGWINRRPAGPFFVWVHLYDPHDPYDPPEPYKSRYAADPYDGEIAYTDAVVGKLISSLRRAGLYNGATIAVMADHGEAFGEHRRTPSRHFFI